MSLSKIEEEVLDFWDRESIFQKSIENRKSAPTFNFYDGPPFASGNPHYGHVLTSSIKDTVLRYKTMRGYNVPRRLGWDCHGLPVENLIEKELNIKSKREIEEMGILKFNEACRNNVFNCVDEWRNTLRRIGRWADYDNDYATMENSYIESVWWVLKTLWNKGLVYRDYRVTPYCYRCGTPVSNFEVNQGYAETEDPSVFIRFNVKKGKFKDTSLLAWTTTPWTLVSNVALVVHPDKQYALVEEKGKKLILLKERISVLEEPKVIEEIKGKDLEGVEYEPLFDDLSKEKPQGIENAFRVYLADFVGTEEGTGVVHTAVMYGEEDFNLGKKYNLPFRHAVDETGKFLFGKWEGKRVKETDEEIIEDLKKRELLEKSERMNHSYPFCWRCDTPLLYYALHTWYVKVEKMKEKLLENNRKIRWVPEHVKEGRFGKWLEGARDWAFSRNRFWGAPIPIWECSSCNELKCIGSKKEFGKELEDLHRPYIDEVTFHCQNCGGEMKRVEEVFDCWFESGSMPYAQWHYPFENKEYVEKNFPADFIAEGVDQTRGWFYTLHVLATALTYEDVGLGKNKPAFLNAIVNGFIFDDKGKKLSKKLKNYPDMTDVFEKYGADSLRFFLLSSTPVGEDYRFSEERVKEVYTGIISTFYHSFSFFQTYSEGKIEKEEAQSTLNKWIFARLRETGRKVVEEMEGYNLTKASRELAAFAEDLSNWYIRRSRDLIKKGDRESLSVFREVLVSFSKILAPFAPFLSEHVYKEITGETSVHLEDFPLFKEEKEDQDILKKMEKGREIASMGLKERADLQIKVRQPLSSLKVSLSAFQEIKDEKEIMDLIKEEVNVRKVLFEKLSGKKIKLDTEITPELKEEGQAREITRVIQNLRKKGNLTLEDKINLYYKGKNIEEVLSKWKDLLREETNIVVVQEGAKEELLATKEIKIEGESVFLGIEKTEK